MINYITPLIKSIITIFGIVLAILSIFKDWKFYKRSTTKNRNINQLLINGWVSFGILSVIAIWLNPFVENKANENIKNSLVPDVNIEILEKTNSQIVISIQATHKITHISTLSLKLNIPGVFKDFTIKTLDRAEKCEIHSSFLVGDYKGTLAETIHIWCKDLVPSAFIRAVINYSPTLPRPIYGSENTPYEEIFMPVMDLHDFAKCTYTWLYQGTNLTETKYINLNYLEFIQKDNENLLYHFQGIRFEEAVKKHNPEYTNPHKARFTKKWLENLEESRKDW